MLYIAGSLLFASALICALAVTFMTFAQYRTRMVAALRTLSLDGIHERNQLASAFDPSGAAVRARLAHPDHRPVRPAPRLAA